MSTNRAEAENGKDIPHKGRRLKLMESYGAFSDERLREVTEKIRGITSRPAPEPAFPHDDSPHPSDEPIGEPIDDTIHERIGEPIESPIESPIDNSTELSDVSPLETPDQIINDSPIETPIHLPIEAPNERAGHDAALLTE